MKSKFFAIEGLDGSGKSTQIKLLMDYLETHNIKTKFVHFPRSNEGVFGELIAKFLRGEFGNVNKVHPQLVALLFAEDRKNYSNTILNWLANDYYVIVDRYVLSNIAFQCAKIQDIASKTELKEWIRMFEYEFNGIPRPDLSIYLDVPFSFTVKSLNEKRNGIEREYLKGKDDIHESDIKLQQAVKLEYESLISEENDIVRIKCFNERNIVMPVEQIHSQILLNINSFIENMYTNIL